MFSETGRDKAAAGRLPTRREAIRQVAKLPFVPPTVVTFSAREARAAASCQSCYPLGHACPGEEVCCPGLVCSRGVCRRPRTTGGPRPTVPR